MAKKKKKRKYGSAAQKAVKSEMHALQGKRKSKKRPQSRKQSIAIGLSEARRKGAKVPRKKSG